MLDESRLSGPLGLEAGSMVRIGQLASVEPWTHDRPDPEHALDTPGLVRARSAVEDALRAGESPILLWGPPGHGKTLLLRSLWAFPPAGFSPIFVPFASVEPDGLAAWIVSSLRRSRPSDPTAALIRLLRAHTLRGARPLLLVDEVQSTPPATLATLFEIVEASRADVHVVVAGWESHTLDRVPGLGVHAVHRIAVSEAWTHVEVEQLLSRVAADAAVSDADLLSAIDVEEALRVTQGNPRRVRKVLAAHIELLELPEAAMAPTHEEERSRAALARLAALGSRATALSRRAVARSVAALGALGRGGRSLGGQTRRLAGRLALGSSRAQQVLAGRSRSLAGGVRSGATRAAGRLEAGAGRVGSAFAALGGYLWSRTRRASTGLERGRARTGTLARSTLRGGGRGLRVAWERSRSPLRRASTAWPWAALASLTGAVALAAWIERPIPGAEAPTASAEAPALVAEVAAPPPSPEPKPAPTVVAVASERIPIRVNSHPWSNVEVDGEHVGSTPLTVSLRPGPHRFRVAMADGRVHDEVVVVSSDRDHVAFR